MRKSLFCGSDGGGGGDGSGGGGGGGSDVKKKKRKEAPLAAAGGRGISVSPFCPCKRTKISVLLSTSVERFCVSRMQDFSYFILYYPYSYFINVMNVLN